MAWNTFFGATGTKVTVDISTKRLEPRMTTTGRTLSSIVLDQSCVPEKDPRVSQCSLTALRAMQPEWGSSTRVPRAREYETRTRGAAPTGLLWQWLHVGNVYSVVHFLGSMHWIDWVMVHPLVFASVTRSVKMTSAGKPPRGFGAELVHGAQMSCGRAI